MQSAVAKLDMLNKSTHLAFPLRVAKAAVISWCNEHSECADDNTQSPIVPECVFREYGHGDHFAVQSVATLCTLHVKRTYLNRKSKCVVCENPAFRPKSVTTFDGISQPA